MRRRVAVAVLCVATWAGAQGFPDPPTLHQMAARDDLAGLARAIDRGAPVDLRDAGRRTPLHVAVQEVHLFAVMLLIARGADPNARDAQARTPLHLAAGGDRRKEGERFHIVKVLVAKGADRKAVDAEGKRPVDYATRVEFENALRP